MQEDICPSTSRNSHIYIRMLHDACVLLGGEHKLAAYLGVPVQLVEAWLNGQGQPPDEVFLRCIDVLEAKPPRGTPAPRRA
jgi:DNA-binding transcriptional regulator YiaG